MLTRKKKEKKNKNKKTLKDDWKFLSQTQFEEWWFLLQSDQTESFYLRQTMWQYLCIFSLRFLHFQMRVFQIVLWDSTVSRQSFCLSPEFQLGRGVGDVSSFRIQTKYHFLLFNKHLFLQLTWHLQGQIHNCVFILPSLIRSLDYSIFEYL